MLDLHRNKWCVLWLGDPSCVTHTLQRFAWFVTTLCIYSEFNFYVIGLKKTQPVDFWSLWKIMTVVEKFVQAVILYASLISLNVIWNVQLFTHFVRCCFSSLVMFFLKEVAKSKGPKFNSLNWLVPEDLKLWNCLSFLNLVNKLWKVLTYFVVSSSV